MKLEASSCVYVIRVIHHQNTLTDSVKYIKAKVTKIVPKVSHSDSNRGGRAEQTFVISSSNTNFTYVMNKIILRAKSDQ